MTKSSSDVIVTRTPTRTMWQTRCYSTRVDKYCFPFRLLQTSAPEKNSDAKARCPASRLHTFGRLRQTYGFPILRTIFRHCDANSCVSNARCGTGRFSRMWDYGRARNEKTHDALSFLFFSCFKVGNVFESFQSAR